MTAVDDQFSDDPNAPGIDSRTPMTDEPQTAVGEAVERLEGLAINCMDNTIDPFDVLEQHERAGYASDLRTILSALDAPTPQPTDEAVRGLVERLQAAINESFRHYAGEPEGTLALVNIADAQALIIAAVSQSAEIARLQALTPKGLAEGDAKWAVRSLEEMKEGGHCGEGNVERRERALWNERIARVVNAIKALPAAPRPMGEGA